MEKILILHIEKLLEGIHFPASKKDLLQYIMSRSEKKEERIIVASLERLPDKIYNEPMEIEEALAKTIQNAQHPEFMK